MRGGAGGQQRLRLLHRFIDAGLQRDAVERIAVEVGLRILKEPGFKPEKTYLMNSRIITRP